MEKYLDNMRKIYDHLGDAVSKKIFSCRALYSISRQAIWLRKILDMRTDSYREVQSILSNHSVGNVYLIGERKYARNMIVAFPDVKWHYDAEAIDSHGECAAWITRYQNEKTGTVIVADPRWPSICKHLQKEVPQMNVFAVGKEFPKLKKKLLIRQYFDLPVMEHAADEVFVDLGAYDGFTSLQFVQWSGGSYKHIYAFEPSNSMYESCRLRLKDLQNCTVIHKAAGQNHEIQDFSRQADGQMIAWKTWGEIWKALRLMHWTISHGARM